MALLFRQHEKRKLTLQQDLPLPGEPFMERRLPMPSREFIRCRLPSMLVMLLVRPRSDPATDHARGRIRIPSRTQSVYRWLLTAPSSLSRSTNQPSRRGAAVSGNTMSKTRPRDFLRNFACSIMVPGGRISVIANDIVPKNTSGLPSSCLKGEMVDGGHTSPKLKHGLFAPHPPADGDACKN
jgi:hypothetical protein